MWWILLFACSDDAALTALEARIEAIGEAQAAVGARLETVETRVDVRAAMALPDVPTSPTVPPQPGEILDAGPNRWSVDRRFLLRIRNAPEGIGGWVSMQPAWRDAAFIGWRLTRLEDPLRQLGFEDRDVVVAIDGKVPTVEVLAHAWRENTVTTAIVVTVERDRESLTFTYEVR